MAAFIPVDPDEVPDYHQGRRGQIYYPLVKDFLESNIVLAKLNPEDPICQGRTMHTIYMSLRPYIQKHELPIKVFKRGGEIHLARLDLLPDGSRDPEYKGPEVDPVNHDKAKKPVKLTEAELEARMNDL